MNLRSLVTLFLIHTLAAHFAVGYLYYPTTPARQTSPMVTVTDRVDFAAKRLEEEGLAAIKYFEKEYGHWGSEEFGLYIVDIKTGEFLFYPHLNGGIELDKINATPFINSVTYNNMGDKAETWWRRVGRVIEGEDLSVGYYTRIVHHSKSNEDYLTVCGKNNIYW